MASSPQESSPPPLPRPGLLVAASPRCPRASAVLVRPKDRMVAGRSQYLDLLADRLRWLANLEDDPDEAAREAGTRLADAGFLADPPSDLAGLLDAVSGTSVWQRLQSLGLSLPLSASEQGQAQLQTMVRETTLEDWASSLIPSDPDS